MTDTAEKSGRILGLATAEGVSGLNIGTYYLSCLIAIMIATFLPQTQAFLLTDYLEIPEGEQGVISGNLNFYAELVIITTVGLFGALSDRIGRRFVMAFGYFVIAIALYLTPRAMDVDDLLLYRLVYAVGIAAVTCMIVIVIADYVRDRSRGKGSGYLGIMNGLGAMIAAFVLIKLPAQLVAAGMTPLEAGYRTYGIVASISLICAILMLLGLKKHVPRIESNKPSIVTMWVEGIKAARQPGIALAYGAAFISRGNLAVAGTFLALWLTTFGTQYLDMSAAEALGRGGMIIGISYMAAFLGAPLFGILTDRVNRTTALMTTLLIAVVGYGGTVFVSDPFGSAMILFMIFVGLSEVGCVITSGVLIAQQTPERIRGSVIGIFNLSGAVGILVASKVGGYLFDHWRPAGPFILFGGLALVVLLWALVVRSRIPRTIEAD